MKRVIEIFLAGLLLIMLSPVMLVVAILVWLFIGRPILFKQQRPGLHGKIFTLYKFRTMATTPIVPLTNPESHAAADAARLSTLGRVLRKFSLDELPQLINVLIGDLSFVGPRPLLVEYLAIYTPEQMRRHEVKPGITGWAQVNGRNAITWEEKFKLDVWYVDNRSFWLDCKICWLTLSKVILAKNIGSNGRDTIDKFKP